MGSAIASRSRSISPRAVAPSRSPSAPTALIRCRAAAIAEAIRVSFVRRSGVCLRAAAARVPWSGAEDGRGDAQAGGRGGVAGFVLAGGDLTGDGAELGGDRGLAGLDALEGVEDQVVLGAARGEHADDVLDPGAAAVGDVGVDVAAPRAGSGGASDALLEARLDPGEVNVDDRRRVLEVVALPGDRAGAEHGELADLEGVLEALERGRFDGAVGDVRLDAVAFAQR